MTPSPPPFTLYPAIDLKGGACVRLHRGEMARATVYERDPGAQAAHFAAAGFSQLHVVDLDGAFAGRSANGHAVAAILKATEAPVQLGGGIRTRETIEAWLERGVTRVILGTAALTDPDLVKEAAAAHPGRVAVGIDARGGRVATEGWAQTSEVTAADLARRFEDCGVAALIVTDIARDGTKTGVNAAFTQEIADAVAIPVIASGGVAGAGDITALRSMEGRRPVSGAILGKALYDGDLSAEDALAAAAAPTAPATPAAP